MEDFEEIAAEPASKNQEKDVIEKPKTNKPITQKLWFWIIVIIVASIIIDPILNPSPKDVAESTPSPQEIERKENSYVRTVAQEVIKKSIKTPKSAEFPILDEWTFEEGDVSYYKIAHAYVDYENIYGTEVRSYFAVTVKISEEGYRVVRIVIDGEKLFEDVITIASDIANEEIANEEGQ